MRGGIFVFLATVALLHVGAAFASESSHSNSSIAELHLSDMDGKAMLPVEDVEDMITVLSQEPAKYIAVDKFVSTDKRLTASVKRYEKVTLGLRDWPIDEVMFLLGGQVEITGSDGVSKIYSKGDLIVIPKGFTGQWRQLSTIEMATVVYGIE